MPSVLAVDSDLETLHAITAALAGFGYQLSVAHSMAQAVTALRESTFDCVLIDEQEEERSHGRLSAELSRYPSQTVALIVLSNGSPVSRLAALKRGAFDSLEKPCDPDLVRLLVTRATERITLARTTRELLDEVETANAELRASREQLQSRVDAATQSLRAKVDELDRVRRELELAQRERDDFVDVIAHELGGPLTAIEGYAEILGHHEVPPELHLRASIIIRSEIRRFARLVQDLTSAAQSPDDLPLHLADHDVVEVVREQVEVIEAMGSGRRVLADTPPGPVHVRCDRDRIGQLVFNLLSNAVKYSGGRDIRVRLKAGVRAAELNVGNDGPAIPIDQLDSIFEPRVRLPRAASRQRSGQGLGLYVARQIAEAHGGTLRALPKESGVEFLLCLPRACKLRPSPGVRRKRVPYGLRTSQPGDPHGTVRNSTLLVPGDGMADAE